MDSPVLLFALALAIVSVVTQCQAGYVMVTSGTDCTRITTKADCETAASALNIADGLTATEENAYGWPPYCYLYDGRWLYFNKYTDGNNEACGAGSKECLCVEPEAEAETENSVEEQQSECACDYDTEFCVMNGLNADMTPHFDCAKKMGDGGRCSGNDDWCLSPWGCNTWGVCDGRDIPGECTGPLCGWMDDTGTDEYEYDDDDWYDDDLMAGFGSFGGRSDEVKNEERSGRMKKQVRSGETKNEE